ncbi:hypothetical protein LU290_02185 [Moraxella nasibovis]|uniref:hypothetical protein n=1 Tax=Moraxella nasibovis TaxID=2904120 RepID=UPI0024100899|nr:hypothetical protein [Moraxella nasibovis]WFF39062.1 hypothetical protein LU290_02185 [Moraxella nasibovis]
MMTVEINILPSIIQKAIMKGERINFANRGQIVAHVVNEPKNDNPTLYEWAMAYDGVDVADIEIDEVKSMPSPNRFAELD